MRKFDLPIFLNKFYGSSLISNVDTKLLTKLKCIYGLNVYSCVQLCIFFGYKYNLSLKLSIFEWSVIYMFLKDNFNFLLFELKLQNVRRVRFLKNYKGWRHIFNLPVRGQRSHTNAKTRKRFKIF